MWVLECQFLFLLLPPDFQQPLAACSTEGSLCAPASPGTQYMTRGGAERISSFLTPASVCVPDRQHLLTLQCRFRLQADFLSLSQ